MMPNPLSKYANDNNDVSYNNYLAEFEHYEADFAKTLGCRLTTLPKPKRMRGKSRVRYILTDQHGDEFYFGSLYSVSRRLGKLQRAMAV